MSPQPEREGSGGIFQNTEAGMQARQRVDFQSLFQSGNHAVTVRVYCFFLRLPHHPSSVCVQIVTLVFTFSFFIYIERLSRRPDMTFAAVDWALKANYVSHNPDEKNVVDII